MRLKLIAIGNCMVGLIAIGYVVLVYFIIERAVQNESTISIENYDYMVKAVRAVMLGIVPLLGAILIVTGINSLQYLRDRKKIEERT